MNILIVKLSSMGDVVHALPVVADIRRHCPEARIDWVVEGVFREVCALNPGVDAILPIALRRWRRTGFWKPEVRREVRQFLQLLRERTYDLVIDCQGLIKSASVARFARATERNGYDAGSVRERPAHWLYSRRHRVPRGWHVVQRNRALAGQALGAPVVGPAHFGIVNPPVSEAVKQWLAVDPFVVMVPGASRDAKLWPEADWMALGRWVQQRGLGVVWIWGSAAEGERVHRLGQAGQTIPPFLSITDTAAVLARAAAVVGLDTGFTHLAGAMGRNTVGIFCDFDARQCAVSGAGRCTSLGGVGQRPALDDVVAALESSLECAVGSGRNMALEGQA